MTAKSGFRCSNEHIQLAMQAIQITNLQFWHGIEFV